MLSIYQTVRLFVAFCVLLTVSFAAKAQFKISNVELIPQLKKGTTYVVMPPTDATTAKQYMDVIQQHWTFSKVEQIDFNEVEKHLSPNNSFLMLANMTVQKTWNDRVVGSYEEFYLSFWTGNEKLYKPKADKSNWAYNMSEVATGRVAVNKEAFLDGMVVYKAGMSGGGHIHTWGTGLLKNYLQQMVRLLEEGVAMDSDYPTIDKTQLKTLKNKTLYVSEAVLVSFNPINADNSEKHDEKLVFQDYKAKHKVVSSEQLNNMILSATEPFYYLLQTQVYHGKYVNVINAATGEVVYTDWDALGYNIKPGDVKKIAKLVEAK